MNLKFDCITNGLQVGVTGITCCHIQEDENDISAISQLPTLNKWRTMSCYVRHLQLDNLTKFVLCEYSSAKQTSLICKQCSRSPNGPYYF